MQCARTSTAKSTQSHSNITRCLRFELIVDMDRLTHDMIEKVLKILGANQKSMKKNLIIYNICSDCFNEVCLEIEKLNKNKKGRSALKKLESAIDPGGISINQKPSRFSAQPPAISRRHRISFNLKTSNEAEQVSMGGYGGMGESRMSLLVKQNNLQQVPAMEELARELEKMNLPETLMVDVIEKVSRN